MPIALSARRSQRAAPRARPTAQSWSSQSPLENEQHPRSRSQDNQLSISASSFCVEEEPVDLSGPFSVKVLGEEVIGTHRKVVYALRVTGSDGERVVRRRYSSFQALGQAMPPKSFFRKRLSPGFMQEHSQSLGSVAASAVAADPYAEAAELCRFLGLRPSEGSPEENPVVATLARRMSTITEAEYENSILSSHVFSSVEGSRPGSSVAFPEAEHHLRLPGLARDAKRPESLGVRRGRIRRRR